MAPGELLVLGAAIGANNLVVALALGALGQARRRGRIVAVFGIFEFTVPLVGLLLGQGLAGALAGSGRWVGAVLLAALGLLAMRPRGIDDEQLAGRVTTIGGLVALAAGLSLDNLAVGFGLGFGDVNPLLVAGVIAAFAVCFTLAGLKLGAAGRRHWERRAQIASGAALVALAVAVGAGWIA
jgi:manganese efflux pump family protein